MSLVETLPDGRRAIILDENVRSIFAVALGDTDDDGKVGVSAVAAVDIPFDGDDAPRVIFQPPEQERFDPQGLAAEAQRQLTNLAKLARIAL